MSSPHWPASSALRTPAAVIAWPSLRRRPGHPALAEPQTRCGRCGGWASWRLPRPLALAPLVLPALLLLDGAQRAGDGVAAVVLLGLIGGGIGWMASRGAGPHPPAAGPHPQPLSQKLGEGGRTPVPFSGT